MSDQTSTTSVGRRVHKNWEYWTDGRRHVLVFSPLRWSSSSDSHVRKSPQNHEVFGRGGSVYTVTTYTLAEDVRFAVKQAERQWGYEGYRRRRRFSDLALAGLEWRLAAGRRVKWVTATMPNGDAEKLGVGLAAWFKRIERYGGGLEYVGTRACARSGLWHFHGLFDMPYIPQEWLQRTWQEAADTYGIVDIKGVRSVGVVPYMAKNIVGYMTDQRAGRLLKSRGWIRDADSK